MLKKFLKKKTYTKKDFLNELLNPVFNLDKIEDIYNEDIELNEKNEKDETYLHHCAKSGYLESCKWLLSKGALLESVTKENETILFYASSSNSSTLVSFLLEEGANTEHLNNHKRTILQEAVISGNKTISILIENTNNINNADIYGNNLIFDAISNGDINIIDLIINHGSIDINKINNDGHTILHKDAVLNNNDLAIRLMQKGADPTILDKTGKNFLFYLISKGIENEILLDKVIEFGCDLNTKDLENNTLLMHAVSNYINTEQSKESHFKMIKKLIKENIQIDSINKKEETVFFDVVRSGDLNLINYFIQFDEIDVNHKNIDGESVLTDLCLNGIKYELIIKNFLKLNADPNIRDNNGSTIIEKLIDVILHFYNRKVIGDSILNRIHNSGEYIDVIKILLESSKVDLGKLNSKEQPLFFDSIVYFNFELFNLLRKYKININQKNIKHHNVIFYLMEYSENTPGYNQKSYLDTLQALINIGVDINAKDLSGSTALHKAVLEKCEYTVKILLDSKPDYHATDNKGRNIIHNSVWKDNLRIFKLIHSYDQNIINNADKYGVLPINYAVFMGKFDLVVTMLDERAHVNNTNAIDPKMIDFFNKFHKNVLNLKNRTDNELDKLNLKLLSDDMKEKFNINA